jgi:hypothetical protein
MKYFLVLSFVKVETFIVSSKPIFMGAMQKQLSRHFF